MYETDFVYVLVICNNKKSIILRNWGAGVFRIGVYWTKAENIVDTEI